MGVRFKSLVGLLAVTLSSAILPQAAWGQTTTSEVPGELSIRDAFRRAYYSNDGNYFQNRTFVGQLNWIFGPFIENEITRDGRAVDRVYQEVLQQQVASDPTLRTPDLVNPFNTSYLLLPATSLTAAEEVPAPIPQPQPFFEQPPAPVIPEVEDSPVPALW